MDFIEILKENGTQVIIRADRIVKLESLRRTMENPWVQLRITYEGIDGTLYFENSSENVMDFVKRLKALLS